MRKKDTVNRGLFLTAFALILLVQPILHESQDLDIDLLSPNPFFEKRHPGDMAAGKEDNFQGLIATYSSILSLIFVMAVIFSFQISPEALPTIPHGPKASILRC